MQNALIQHLCLLCVYRPSLLLIHHSVKLCANMPVRFCSPLDIKREKQEHVKCFLVGCKDQHNSLFVLPSTVEVRTQWLKFISMAISPRLQKCCMSVHITALLTAFWTRDSQGRLAQEVEYVSSSSSSVLRVEVSLSKMLNLLLPCHQCVILCVNGWMRRTVKIPAT